MAKFFVIIILTLLTVKTCDKAQDDALDTGTITKLDFRECACCGGWFIDIGDSTYRFYEIPEKSSLELSAEKLPVEVRLKWQKAEKPCLGDEIKILYIEEN